MGRAAIISLAGTGALALFLGFVLGASMSGPRYAVHPTGYTVDRLKAAGTCAAGRMVYVAPNGLLWAWAPGWSPVEPRGQTACP